MSFWLTIAGQLKSCCNLLLPPACLLCGERLPTDGPAGDFCAACRLGLPRPAPASCPVCAVAYRTPIPSDHHCENCLRHPPPFNRVVAVGPYAGTLQEAVQRFKYRGQLSLERPMGTLLVDALKNAGVRCPSLVVPVPLHVSRLRERGYNQSLQLARQVGRQLAVPVAPHLLRRVRATATQQGLDAVSRKHNLRKAFAVAGQLTGCHLLLVDDVMTTGATGRECAAALRAAGAATIDIAVIGRA